MIAQASAAKIAWAMEHGRDPDQCCRICFEPGKVQEIAAPNDPHKSLKTGGTVINCEKHGYSLWSAGAVLTALEKSDPNVGIFPLGKPN